MWTWNIDLGRKHFVVLLVNDLPLKNYSFQCRNKLAEQKNTVKSHNTSAWWAAQVQTLPESDISDHCVFVSWTMIYSLLNWGTRCSSYFCALTSHSTRGAAFTFGFANRLFLSKWKQFLNGALLLVVLYSVCWWGFWRWRGVQVYFHHGLFWAQDSTLIKLKFLLGHH